MLRWSIASPKFPDFQVRAGIVKLGERSAAVAEVAAVAAAAAAAAAAASQSQLCAELNNGLAGVFLAFLPGKLSSRNPRDSN